ncbi:hypothetical protein KEM48_014600 [Puccinia striiformis f. sp. tritici PST-130]|nr:hypothetical protein KEM48_014600 [Puccinia striiformis f. sp. tritici PST-130]
MVEGLITFGLAYNIILLDKGPYLWQRLIFASHIEVVDKNQVFKPNQVNVAYEGTKLNSDLVLLILLKSGVRVKLMLKALLLGSARARARLASSARSLALALGSPLGGSRSLAAARLTNDYISKGCVTSETCTILSLSLVKGRIRDSNSGQGTPQVLTLPTELKLPLIPVRLHPSP